MKRILITGATGRIGSNLTRRLLKKGYEVISFVLENDPLTTKLHSMSTEILYGDIQDYESLNNATEGADAVVHLAALFGKHRKGISKQKLLNVNVVGTLNTLEACVNNSVDRYVFASTDATYPVTKALYTPVDENHPQRPYNIYGLTKLLSEKTCLEYSREYGLATTILRYGTVLTPPEVITMLKRGEEKNYKIYVDKTGKPFKGHISDVRDVVEGTILALEKKAAENEVFNMLGCAIYNSQEAAEYAAELAGVECVTVRMPYHSSFEVDNTKAKAVLGYRPKYDIFRMIEDSFKYLGGQDVGTIPAE